MKTAAGFLKRWWVGLALLALSPFLWWYVHLGAGQVDFPNSNFFKLWLAGHLAGIGGNPYSPPDWLNGHAVFGATWIPESIFLYPLPLAYLLIPLGLLSLSQAYFVWAFLTLAATVLSMFLLLDLWKEDRLKIFALPMLVALFFFAPTLEAPGKGTLGGLLLLAMVLALYQFDRGRWFTGGMLSALLLIKPTFGAPALILLGLWFLFSRGWRGILGIATGSLLLYVLGAIANPQWPIQFLGSGQQKIKEYLGQQPTLLNLAGFLCKQGPACSYGLGAVFSLVLVGLTVFLLFRKARPLDSLEAVSLILTVSLLVTPYLWSYDFVLLIIPLSWIVHQLILRTRSYWVPIVFLIFLDVAAGTGLYLQNLSPQKDLWNILLPLFLLGMMIWMMQSPVSAAEKANAKS
jgi:Glycosyltransferase family 87